MGRSMFLFALPWRFEGLGRLVDLGSTFDGYNSEVSDAAVLAQDWAAVGDDLREAMSGFVAP